MSHCSKRDLAQKNQQHYLKSSGIAIAMMEAPKMKEGKYLYVRFDGRGTALVERVISGYKSIECVDKD
jgi:hypothetical protein